MDIIVESNLLELKKLLDDFEVLVQKINNFELKITSPLSLADPKIQ